MFKRTGIIEILLQLLPKVNGAGMCVAKHSNDKCLDFGQRIMPCFASLYRGLQMRKICIKP
jgi:hypothetical protein